MLTDSQIQKVTATVSALYSDPEFDGVTSMKVEVSQTPPPPTPVVDEVDVPRP